MKAVSISQLKEELIVLSQKEVIDLCLRLAKYKKENKELLAYLLLDAHDVQGYVQSIKQEIDSQFEVLPKNNWYLYKKGLRKILRAITKYSKYVGAKEPAVEMLLHFCSNMKHFGVPFQHNNILNKLYSQQVKKLNALVDQVHEDLQYDYQRQIEQLR